MNQQEEKLLGHNVSVLTRYEADMVSNCKRALKEGAYEDNMIEKLRNLCLSRGVTGILDLGRVFRRVDDDGHNQLNLKKFAKGLKDYGFDDVSDEEVHIIFKEFNDGHGGLINMDEFLEKVRPPLSESRKKVIDAAFKKVDKTGSGETTIKELKRAYCVNSNPMYITGEESEEEIVKKFLDNFEVSGNADGRVTKEEFINYYAGVSASIDTDGYFDLVIRQVFKL